MLTVQQREQQVLQRMWRLLQSPWAELQGRKAAGALFQPCHRRRRSSSSNASDKHVLALTAGNCAVGPDSSDRAISAVPGGGKG